MTDTPPQDAEATPLEEMAETMRERTEQIEMTDAPFSLTPEIGKRRAKQHDLF